MRLEDLKLLARKIVVGALVTVLPLLILLGGLQLTQRIWAKNTTSIQSQSDAK